MSVRRTGSGIACRMGVRQFLHVLVLSAAGFGSVSAAEPLTLETAVTQAVQANPGLKATVLERDARALERDIARGRRYPAVGFDATYTRYSDPYLIHPIEQPGAFPPLDTDVASAGLSLRVPLYAGGKLVAGESLAANTTESAVQRLLGSEQDLIFNVVSSYAKALQLRDLSVAEARRIAGLQAEVDEIQRKIDEGRAARLEVLRVQSQLSRAQFDQVATAQGERDALALLAALMDVPVRAWSLVDLPALPDSLPDSDEAAVQQAVRDNPRVRQAQAEVDAAVDRVAIARGDRRPSVDLVANSRTRRGGDWEGRDDWDVGVALNVPLFDAGIRKSRVDQANLDRLRAEENLRGVVNEVETDVRTAFGSLRTSEKQLDAARRALDESDEALRIEAQSYRAGRSTVTDLLSAEAARWAALASLNQAEYDQFVAAVRLYRALGRLTPDMFTDGTPSPAEPPRVEEGMS